MRIFFSILFLIPPAKTAIPVHAINTPAIFKKKACEEPGSNENVTFVRTTPIRAIIIPKIFFVLNILTAAAFRFFTQHQGPARNFHAGLVHVHPSASD
jgi:hypothetical protein